MHGVRNEEILEKVRRGKIGEGNTQIVFSLLYVNIIHMSFTGQIMIVLYCNFNLNIAVNPENKIRIGFTAKNNDMSHILLFVQILIVIWMCTAVRNIFQPVLI